jgi:hypothetical protein
MYREINILARMFTIDIDLNIRSSDWIASLSNLLYFIIVIAFVCWLRVYNQRPRSSDG